MNRFSRAISLAIAIATGLASSYSVEAGPRLRPTDPKYVPDVFPFIPMEFIKLGPAKFLMGSSPYEWAYGKSYSDCYDAPQHEASIPYEFEIQITTVTQAQYARVMGENDSEFKYRINCRERFTHIDGVPVCPNHPVENVDKIDQFISRLNSMQNKYTYRLPTEEEWEFAARGGNWMAFFFGNSPKNIKKFAWSSLTYDSYSDYTTHPVASLAPNAYGLYNMVGNVRQVVQASRGYPVTSFTDHLGSSPAEDYVFRGGSFQEEPMYLRSSLRLRGDAYSLPTGFRLVRTRR